MIKTTLCYLERGGCWLMMLRNKKKGDVNAGKWVGVGGKFLPGETPEACLVREVREETGYALNSYTFHGIVTFVSDRSESEEMYLYSSADFAPVAQASVQDFAERAAAPGADNPLPVPQCDEGTFAWVPIADVPALNLWPGDRIFLERMLAGDCAINLTLIYEGDDLVTVRES